MNKSKSAILYLGILSYFLMIVNTGYTQSCDGADGLFPPLSGNTVVANGDICANTAVVPYRWQITYTNVDDGGDPNQYVEFFIDWADGTTQTVEMGAGDNFIQQTGPNSYISTVTHLFPANGGAVQCEYTPVVSLQIDGAICPSTTQNPSPVVRWNTDDENTGVMELSEQVSGDIVYEICAGDTETIRFEDRSEFNCVPPAFLGFPPNIRTRWFQFIYGGNPVNNTITSATGIEINTNTGTNPEGLGLVTVPTNTTYASDVVERAQPINAPTEVSFDITVPDDAIAGQEFAITLNNWNDCNRFENGGIPTGNAPTPFTAIIRIVADPPPPTYTPTDYCINNNIALNVTTSSGGDVKWYSDATATTLVHTGQPFDPVNDPPLAERTDNTVPGVHTYYATETLGNDCEGDPVATTFEIYDDPTPSDAGTDVTHCATSINLNGNVPATGTGTWTVVSGTGLIDDPTDPATLVTNLNSTTPSVFRWTIVNGLCSDFSDVQISNDADPDIAVAGPDQFECDISGATMDANTPATGTGLWTQTGGPVAGINIVDPTDPDTQITGLVGGNSYEFTWTISNGTCSDTQDEVIVTTDLNPPSDAGDDFSICDTGTVATMNGSDPAPGTGTWTVISGPGTVVSPNDRFTNVNNVTNTTVLEWEIVNGVCTSTDQVEITIDASVTPSNAGPDDVICANSYVLGANPPVEGIGEWSIAAGNGTFGDVNDPATTVSNLDEGVNTFTWIISNSCNSDATSVNITNNNPTTADAGTDIVVCNTITNLSGNDPTSGVGTWTITNGDGFGNINDPGEFNSGFTGTQDYTYNLRWRINNGLCPVSDDFVDVTLHAEPSNAVAGPPQTICGNSTNLAAVPPALGTGLWSIISGDGFGAFIDDTDPTTQFSGTAGEAYTLQWQTSNGTCADKNDQVIITFDEDPTVAVANDVTVCAASLNLDGNNPTVGTGLWTFVSNPDGNGAITTPTSHNSNFTGTRGITYILQWTISNGTCTDDDDQAFVLLEEEPTTADAGPDDESCGNAITLGGNTPVVGSGQWTVVSGAGGSFPDDTNPTGTFVGTPGNSYQLRWTISNGSCAVSEDDVFIDLYQTPTASNAGTDQDICGNNYTLQANLPIVGTGQWVFTDNSDGLGFLDDPTNRNATLTGTPDQMYSLEWVISNGTCTPSSDEVTISYSDSPTNADAGSDEIICGNSTNLPGNNPTVGTGLWTFVTNPDGLGVIADDTSPTSQLNGTPGQTYSLQWTTSNGVCPSTLDVVNISFDDAIPQPVINGDTEICAGETKSFVVNGSDPANFNYLWNVSNLPASTTIAGGSGTPFQFISLTFSEAFSGDLFVVAEDKVSGCISPAGNLSLVGNDSPDMVLTSSDPDNSICAGEEVTFTATDNNGIADEYEFFLNGSVVQRSTSNEYITSTLPAINTITVRGYSGSCPSNDSNDISTTVLSNPAVQNVQGGGNYCDGDAGVNISLSGSQINVDYELFRDGVTTGIIISSTGGGLTFPIQDIPGTYTVTAANALGCTVDMNGIATVAIDPLPTEFILEGSATLCPDNAGTEIRLLGSEVDVSYQLERDGNPETNPIPGTGLELSMGTFTVGGVYSIMATNDLTGCTLQFTETTEITIEPLPVLTIETEQDICSGETTSLILESDLGNSTFTWDVNFDPDLVSGASDNQTAAPEGTVIANNLINLTDEPQEVTYLVTPNNFCPGEVTEIIMTVFPEPEGIITGNVIMCKGSRADFSFELSGDGSFSISYSVNDQVFNQGGLGNKNTFTLIPESNTEVTLISVTDVNGCTSFPNESINIEVLEVDPNITLELPDESCSPLEAVFRNANPDENITYTYKWGDGSDVEVNNGTEVSHTYQNSSNSQLSYEAVVTATHNNELVACEEIMTFEILVSPAIEVETRLDQVEGCAPLDVSFVNVSRGATSHLWTIREKGSAEIILEFSTRDISTTLENNTTSNIIYEVSYTGSNAYCSETEITEIIVAPEIEPAFLVNGSQMSSRVFIDDPTHAVIDNQTPNVSGWNYSWNYGDENILDSYNPTTPYNYTEYGSYLITLEVENREYGCSAQKSVEMIVQPVTPVIDFTADPLEGCLPVAVNFTNLSFSADPGKYLWEFFDSKGNPVGNIVADNPTFTFYDAGIYTVKLTGENSYGNKNSKTIDNYITVHDKPIAAFSLRPEVAFLPDARVFTLNTSQNATEYHWDFGDGETAASFEPVHEYSATGEYTVTLSATNELGCTDSLSLMNVIEVKEGGTVRVPNAFTPSTDGPNGGRPSSGSVNDVFLPSFEGVEKFKMQIFDRWGNLLFESNDPELGWDGYNENSQLFPTGVYVYKLQLEFSNKEKLEKIGDLTLIR